MNWVHLAIATTALSLVLYGTMMALFARAMLRSSKPTSNTLVRTPRVTILKPLAGVDDDLDENLESFTRLTYPSFEVLLGVADASDPAYAAARRFMARHPRLDIEVVITDQSAALNPKVAQLLGLVPNASGDIYVISDSNVRVGPGYLESLVAGLADPEVGMVTGLFVGAGEQTFGAALENLQLCASTAPGIAAVAAVSKRPFTVGKSMAVRRADLERLGGFASVGHFLAEDHVLGRRFMDAGFLVRTVCEPIENRNVRCGLVGTFERHSRWAKTRRSLFLPAFTAEPLMTPIVVASLCALAAPPAIGAALLAVACVCQMVGASIAMRVARGRAVPWWCAPLEVFRSYLSFVCWLRAWTSQRIAWRGHPFVLHRGTLIVPVVPSTTGSSARREWRQEPLG